ncbi:hypothetical protein TRFO_32748 [Tritrichomonas foetus]|uniref:Uncharacterized protein n=1 Tax=Tritrichomonas foetus TaxID=1144522 RepID=A0A1J4JTC1_9EUKA|nr:hypothetical protein TRFO_32748 [Tritrichomonas foetus]|eukprot:OHT00517.1 hypothetical protein TRFO_32748 [Tritrichomonas foetus]
MSVREKPVANRYLDLKEKRISYGKHVHAVRTVKPSIDTSQPDMPRRLQIAAINNAKYRRDLRRDQARNARKILEIENLRPQTSRTPRHYIVAETFEDETDSFRPQTPAKEVPLKEIYIFQYDDCCSNGELRANLVPDRLRTPVDSQPPPSPYITEFQDQKLPSKHDSIKIGFSKDPIIETLEDDESKDEQPTSYRTDRFLILDGEEGY